MRDLVFIDVETTGLDPQIHGITEIAISRGSVQDFLRSSPPVMSWFVKPFDGCVVDSRAVEINGYDEKMWEEIGALGLWIVGDLISKHLDGAIPVGWNVGFDIAFIKAELRRLGKSYSPHYHSLDLASWMFPHYWCGDVPNLKLESACDYFKVSNEGSHRAKTDVLRTIEVFRCMCEERGLRKRLIGE